MSDMKIRVGFDKWGGKPLYWDLINAVNPHCMITGPSGYGKTYNICGIVEQMIPMPEIERVYIFDVHGDIGDTLPQEQVSTIAYTETKKNGINPLVISSCPDFGGPRKKIRNLISLLNSTSRPLGNRQEPTFTRVLEGLYKSKGIYLDKPETWTLKSPDLTELKQYLARYTEMAMTGSTYQVSKQLQKVRNAIKKVRAGYREDADHETVAELKLKAHEAYGILLNSFESGLEMDKLMKFGSDEILKSLLDRIVGIESTGIFSSGGEKFDRRKKVYRFDLRTLNQEEQLLFISTMSELIYSNAIERGFSDYPREFIIIDEAQKYISKDPDNILNKIITGARKFGLGMCLASQSIHHFSEDLMTNTGMKYVLGVDDIFIRSVSRKTGIEEKSLKHLRPKTNAIINIKSKDTGVKVGWQDIVFDRSNARTTQS